MPRWTSCYIDKRAITHKGQMGLYKCEKCGKLHWYKMCARKTTKHIFCSTKCKKDSQVKLNRPLIDNKLYKVIYDKNYELVKTCAFQICENNSYKLQWLEDCMQYGFIELWKTYNRNKMNCNKKYLRKAVKHAILDNIKYLFIKNEKYVACDDFDLIKLVDKKGI